MASLHDILFLQTHYSASLPFDAVRIRAFSFPPPLCTFVSLLAPSVFCCFFACLNPACGLHTDLCLSWCSLTRWTFLSSLSPVFYPNLVCFSSSPWLTFGAMSPLATHTLHQTQRCSPYGSSFLIIGLRGIHYPLLSCSTSYLIPDAAFLFLFSRSGVWKDYRGPPPLV